jgi:hypothetical protein
MHQLQLTCPPVGHKTFEKSLQHIIIGDTVTPNQITKIVRPRTCQIDDLGIQFGPGELQKVDVVNAMSIFEYPRFIAATFQQHAPAFEHAHANVFQFQTHTATGSTFVFGLFITDSSRNLIDYCVESHQANKRKPILMRLIRAICTPASVARKLSH